MHSKHTSGSSFQVKTHDFIAFAGLLASVPADQAEACIAALREHGCQQATAIGTVASISEQDAESNFLISCQ